MPMDEVIREIEQMDSENMQDVLDALMRRYRKVFPGYSLLILTLQDDPRNRSEQLAEITGMLEKMQ